VCEASYFSIRRNQIANDRLNSTMNKNILLRRNTSLKSKNRVKDKSSAESVYSSQSKKG
jgi:hypothetical protein